MMLKDLSLGYLATSKRENEIVICIKNCTFTAIEGKRTNNLSEGRKNIQPELIMYIVIIGDGLLLQPFY